MLFIVKLFIFVKIVAIATYTLMLLLFIVDILRTTYGCGTMIFKFFKGLYDCLKGLSYHTAMFIRRLFSKANNSGPVQAALRRQKARRHRNQSRPLINDPMRTTYTENPNVWPDLDEYGHEIAEVPDNESQFFPEISSTRRSYRQDRSVHFQDHQWDT